MPTEIKRQQCMRQYLYIYNKKHGYDGKTSGIIGAIFKAGTICTSLTLKNRASYL
jgi:hypothetical protein